MNKRFKKIWSLRRGASSIEYGLLVMLIGAVAFVGVRTTGTSLTCLFQATTNGIQGLAAASCSTVVASGGGTGTGGGTGGGTNASPIGPALGVSPTALVFSPSSQTAQTQVVTLTNPGTANVTGLIYAIQPSGQGYSMATSSCGPTLPAGASCTYNITVAAGASVPTAYFVAQSDSAVFYIPLSTSNTCWFVVDSLAAYDNQFGNLTVTYNMVGGGGGAGSTSGVNGAGVVGSFFFPMGQQMFVFVGAGGGGGGYSSGVSGGGSGGGGGNGWPGGGGGGAGAGTYAGGGGGGNSGIGLNNALSTAAGGNGGGGNGGFGSNCNSQCPAGSYAGPGNNNQSPAAVTGQYRQGGSGGDFNNMARGGAGGNASAGGAAGMSSQSPGLGTGGGGGGYGGGGAGGALLANTSGGNGGSGGQNSSDYSGAMVGGRGGTLLMGEALATTPPLMPPETGLGGGTLASNGSLNYGGNAGLVIFSYQANGCPSNPPVVHN